VRGKSGGMELPEEGKQLHSTRSDDKGEKKKGGGLRKKKYPPLKDRRYVQGIPKTAGKHPEKKDSFKVLWGEKVEEFTRRNRGGVP